MTGGGKGAPAPPDYMGAAEAQAQGSRQNVIEQTYANRPNISTPWGGVTWTRPEYPGAPGYAADESGTGGAYGGGAAGGGGGGGGIGGGGFGAGGPVARALLGEPGAGAGQSDPYAGYDPSGWQMNVNLPPELQAAAEAQMRVQRGRSALTEQMLPQAGADLARGIDWGAMPGVTGGEDARNRAEEALYGRYQSRLDPQWQQQGADLENKLVQQGLDPGTEAFTRAMGDFYRGRNDAYQTAQREAVTGGGAEASRQYQLEAANRARALQEAYQRQYGGLNALNAALQGQQVQMPQFPGFGQAGQAQAPNYLQAANLGYQGALNQYGAQQAGLQGLMGGFGGLAGLPFMF